MKLKTDFGKIISYLIFFFDKWIFTISDFRWPFEAICLWHLKFFLPLIIRIVVLYAFLSFILSCVHLVLSFFFSIEFVFFLLSTIFFLYTSLLLSFFYSSAVLFFLSSFPFQQTLFSFFCLFDFSVYLVLSFFLFTLNII